MSYAVNADLGGGGSVDPQTFKTHCGDWETRYNAYVGEGMISIQAMKPHRFITFRTLVSQVL